MPADGISLPPKRDFGTSRWGGSKVRLYQRRHRTEGVMTACGTFLPCQPRRAMSGFRGKAACRKNLETAEFDPNSDISPRTFPLLVRQTARCGVHLPVS
jgi:hypothetical protein